jgi:hypothetical protein
MILDCSLESWGRGRRTGRGHPDREPDASIREAHSPFRIRGGPMNLKRLAWLGVFGISLSTGTALGESRYRRCRLVGAAASYPA